MAPIWSLEGKTVQPKIWPSVIMSSTEKERANRNREVAKKRLEVSKKKISEANAQMETFLELSKLSSISSSALDDIAGASQTTGLLGDASTTSVASGEALPGTSIILAGKFQLLDSPGLPLTNSLNKCWYHSSLQLLTTIPAIRQYLQAGESKSPFYAGFKDAIHAIANVQNAFPVGAFFKLVKDFSGINNRYGQIAVPDFLEYLATQLPDVFKLARSVTNTKLQCLRCNWVSYSTSEDMLLKLYIPPETTKRISLTELFTYNFITTLPERSVHCGKCLRKTSQKSSKELFSDLVCLELIRVTERKGSNSMPVW